MNRQIRLELAKRLLPQLQRFLPSSNEALLSSETFVRVLEKHAQAAAWGENPLLFSLAATVYVKTGTLPLSRATLYREVIEAVLKTREPDPIRCRMLQRMLTELALWLHQSSGRTFSVDEVVTFLLDVQRKSWGDATDLINQIRSSGIIEVVARDTYGFRHQTFQEYLAAVELARRLTSSDPTQYQQTWDLAWSKRTYSRWTEILRLMVGVLIHSPIAGGKSVAHRWLQALIAQRKSKEGDPGNLGLALAIKSLVEVSESEEWLSPNAIEFEQEIIYTWFEELVVAARYQRSTKVEKLRILAYDIGLLNKHATSTILNILISALEDRSENIREEVVSALGELGERMPLKCLFAPLQDQSGRVQNAAQMILDEQGVRLLSDPALMDALNHETEDVRSAAVRALGKQGEHVPLDLLIQALQDEGRSVRRATVRALGKQGERVPLDLLIQALQDKSEYVRSAAVEALGEQGELVPLDLLIQALQDESWDVRSAAVEALGKQGEHVPLDLLIQALQDEGWSVRKAAVEALGEQGELVPFKYLLALVGDEDDEVRNIAIEVISEFAPEMFASVATEAIAVLQEKPVGRLLGSLIEGFIAEVLGNIGYSTPQVFNKLIPLLDWHYWQVQVKAAQALGKIRRNIPDLAIKHLLVIRSDSAFNQSVREAADDALSEILSLETGIEDE